MEYKAAQVHVGGGVDLWQVNWKDIQEGDDIPFWDKIGMMATVEVTGDANGVTILGQIAGDEFFPLNDSDTLALNFVYPGIKSCNDMFRKIKPKKSGPGIATVSMLIRRN